jgi:glycosyltransferase involved in cell wall biosynthesis
MPFSYGRWGFAPGLVRDAIAIKRVTGALLGVMVHEAWVAMVDWRTCLMGTYQRAQLRSLLLLADVLLVSTEYLRGALGSSAVHVPVGSNISPSVVTREHARRELGLRDELVVTLFGTGNPHRMLAHPEAALAALVEERGATNLRVLNLGAGAGPLRVPPGLRVDTPGSLPADELSRCLRASDVLLLSFSDGVSTRRGTLMAGLEHGLPVVSLSGVSTDDVLLKHPEALVLTPVGDHHAFSAAVLDITSDPLRLESTGRAARTLYASEFDWPVIAERLMEILSGSAPRARRSL